jgi:hypothetical protein
LLALGFNSGRMSGQICRLLQLKLRKLAPL